MIADNYLNYCHDINKACEPLFKYLPIRKISYLEVHPNGEFITVCSDQLIFEEVIKAGFLKTYPIDTLSLYNIPGYYLNDYYNFSGDLEEIQGTYERFFENFDYGHPFFMVEHENINNAIIYKVYIYESMLGKSTVNHEYINNIDTLRRFNKHFQTVISAIKPSIKPLTIEPDALNGLQDIVSQSKNAAIDAGIQKNALHAALNFLPCKLTRRESEIAFWYSKGKTSLETASILGISFRTVENIFERAKTKLGCRSKTDFLLQYSDVL